MKNTINIMLFLFLVFYAFSSCNSEDNSIKRLGQVYYLKIIQDFGDVSPSYSSYIKKNLEIINKNPYAKAVIIEIDTPGGRIGDAQKIAKYIKNTKVTTITFVNDSAYSAGAIISLSANYTIISEGGKIGDAYPIMIGENGKPTSIKDKRVHDKMLSGLKALVKGLAEKRIKRLVKDLSRRDQRYSHLRNTSSVRNLKKIFGAMVDPSIKLIKEEDGYDLDSNKLLTLTADEAKQLGVVDDIFNQVDEILRSYHLDQYELVKLKAGTSDQLLNILINPVVVSILLTLGMMGMVMEFWTSGWGVPGTIGILLLSLFFYGQIVGADASLSSLVLFIIGLILLAVELFVVPGFGIIGAAGILALLLSLITALGVDPFDLSSTSHLLKNALITVILSITFSVILLIAIGRFIPKTKTFSKITLKDSKISGISFNETNHDLEGKNGITITVLRPSGIAMINGKKYDVISEGEYVEKGSSIEVMQIGEEGNIIVKRKS